MRKCLVSRAVLARAVLAGAAIASSCALSSVGISEMAWAKESATFTQTFDDSEKAADKSETGEIRSADATGKSEADLEVIRDDIVDRPYGATPEEAFRKQRAREIENWEKNLRKDGKSFDARAYRAVTAPVIEATRLPLELVKNQGDDKYADLQFRAVDKKIDFKVNARCKHYRDGWKVVRQEFKGSFSTDVFRRSVENFRNELPGETTMFIVSSIFIFLAVIVGAVGSVWLCVNAFRKHWGWGLAVFLFQWPAGVVFIIFNWKLGRVPFAILCASWVLAICGMVGPMSLIFNSESAMKVLRSEGAGKGAIDREIVD